LFALWLCALVVNLPAAIYYDSAKLPVSDDSL